jgi:predicted tellurium resistance membrane protein TerC
MHELATLYLTLGVITALFMGYIATEGGTKPRQHSTLTYILVVLAWWMVIAMVATIRWKRKRKEKKQAGEA